MSPRITIVMPVYNGERYLAGAVASALAQDYDNFEIVIVNDGATDRYSARIAQAFRDANPDRIRYIYQENGGVAAALNTAIGVATGEFFAWLSHDDLYYSDRLRQQMEFYQKFDLDGACVFSNFRFIDENKNKLSSAVLNASVFEAIPEVSLLQSGINGCALLVPMKIMRQYGPFDTSLRYAQDFDLWGRILQDHPFVFDESELVLYRQHAEQGSQHPGATREGNALWINLLEQQDEIRRVQMFGSRRLFYARTAEFLRNSSPYTEAVEYAQAMLAKSNAGLLVSVLLLVADDVAATQRSIDSVLAQSHQNWEILLLTERWTACAEAINTAIVDRARVRWVTPAASEAELLNTGLDLAKGDYIAFVRSGDYLFANRLSLQLDALVDTGRVVSHGSYFFWWKELSSRRVFISMDKESVTRNTHLLSPIDIAFSTVMIHRSVSSAGLRFETETYYPLHCFIAELANLYDWIGVSERLAEVVIDHSSPQINLALRQGIEAHCRRQIPPSDRLFCSLNLAPSAEAIGGAYVNFIQSFNDEIEKEQRPLARSEFSVEATSDLPEAVATYLSVFAPNGTVLIVSHLLGGGIERFVKDEIRKLRSDGFGVLLLQRAVSGGIAELDLIFGNDGVSRTRIMLRISGAAAIADLKSLNVRRAEIHSLYSYPFPVWDTLIRSFTQARVPYDVFIHDYTFACPRLFLTLPDGRYCGNPGLEDCERCIAQYGGEQGKPTVSSWRAVHGFMLRNAAHVVAPDQDVKSRFQAFFPELAIEVHPLALITDPYRRILLLGHCVTHKGSDMFVRTAEVALRNNSPIEFVLLGTTDRSNELKDMSNVRLLGRYLDGAFKSLVADIRPDLVWFPGSAAETFSYTLSMAFDCGIFPVAFDIGAIASRIRATGRGRLLPLSMIDDPDAVVEQLLSVKIDSGFKAVEREEG